MGVHNYELFSTLLMMRPYQKDGKVGMSNSISREEVKKWMIKMQDKRAEFNEVMRTMPRELLLVLRNLNLARSINKDLGAPINRFIILARVAAAGALQASSQETYKWWPQRVLQSWSQWKESVKFDIALQFYSFVYWIANLYLSWRSVRNYI
jgi:aarF domain-containing kinase